MIEKIKKAIDSIKNLIEPKKYSKRYVRRIQKRNRERVIHIKPRFRIDLGRGDFDYFD